MEKTSSKLMKVTPNSEKSKGHFIAHSFGEFCLQLMSSDLSLFAKMLGEEKFTDVYFKTSSGNIYWIFSEKDYTLSVTSWFLLSKSNQSFVYSLKEKEMYFGFLKVGSSFFYGDCYATTGIMEIVCVNKSKLHFNISSAPEAIIVKQFEGEIRGRLCM